MPDGYNCPFYEDITSFPVSSNPFTFQERAELRDYMGLPLIYTNTHSGKYFESVMDAINGIVDGYATITRCRFYMWKVRYNERRLERNMELMVAPYQAEEVKLDAVHSRDGILEQGRMYINRIAAIFDMDPAGDFYGRPKYTPVSDCNKLKNLR